MGTEEGLIKVRISVPKLLKDASSCSGGKGGKNGRGN